MFTEPKIVTSDDLSQRSYITFYLDNKRIREYNGKSLNLPIHPNRAQSVPERDKLLRKLQFEFHKALEGNCYPANNPLSVQEPSVSELNTSDLLDQALQKKLTSSLSKTYKRNLKLIHRHIEKSARK